MSNIIRYDEISEDEVARAAVLLYEIVRNLAGVSRTIDRLTKIAEKKISFGLKCRPANRPIAGSPVIAKSECNKKIIINELLDLDVTDGKVDLLLLIGNNGCITYEVKENGNVIDSHNLNEVPFRVLLAMPIYETLCGALSPLARQAELKGFHDLARKLKILSIIGKNKILNPLKTYENLYRKYGRDITW